MYFFDNPYYKVNKQFLSILGHWPYQPAWKRRVHHILVVLWMMTILVPELIKLVEVWSDLDIVFECIPPLGLHLVNLIKWINCIFNIDKLKKLLTHLENDWASRENGIGSKTLREYAERGRILTVGYILFMFLSAGFYICLPLVPIFLDFTHPLNESRPREPLFLTEYFVDQDQYFVSIFIHALLTNFTSVTIIVAIDTMYGALIQYACAIFAEVSEELERCQTNRDESLNVNETDDYTYHQIINCVKKQNEAIEFCNLMESSYTIYFLFLTGTNVLLMSFTGVQTVTRLDDPKLAIRYGSYTFGQIIHVFFGFWHGQLLIDHSLRINMAVYRSEWYKWSFRSRKLVTLIMTRSAKSCHLSAGKLFFVSLETFSKVIKTAMSYFTVLSSLR